MLYEAQNDDDDGSCSPAQCDNETNQPAKQLTSAQPSQQVNSKQVLLHIFFSLLFVLFLLIFLTSNYCFKWFFYLKKT